MTERGSLTRRLLALNEALTELEHPDACKTHTLTTNRMLRAAVERWLQISIESCLDIANHVIAARAWTPPSTGREAFLILAAHNELDPELARKLGRAVGLRNLLVHDYASIDLEQLASIVAHDLDDLRAFARHATRWLT